MCLWGPAYVEGVQRGETGVGVGSIRVGGSLVRVVLLYVRASVRDLCEQDSLRAPACAGREGALCGSRSGGVPAW